MTRGLLLAMGACLAVSLLGAACGGDDDAGASNEPGKTPTVGASQGTPAVLTGPASKYSLLQEDLGRGYITDIRGTVVLDLKSYAATPVFKTVPEGEKQLTEWGYIDGYQTAVEPEGREEATLTGAYALVMETHLFNDAAGAKKFYDYLQTVRNKQSTIVQAQQVGEESVVAYLTTGKIRGSNVDRAIHQLYFRRGNLVGVVMTIGAAPFMKPDHVAAAAKLMDDKALGTRPAPSPTPTSNYTPPANRQPTTVPATATARP
ncbi:MAG: hypothetical protein IT302_10655 [Dehalococcoidia bacterium]|nr:hypothetical protein [Dehalococcoidia bacterium]